jgi:hypothetical protein
MPNNSRWKVERRKDHELVMLVKCGLPIREAAAAGGMSVVRAMSVLKWWDEDVRAAVDNERHRRAGLAL